MKTTKSRLTDKELELLQAYAKSNSLSLGEFIKNTLLEKIEDEYDYQVGEREFKKFLLNNEIATPILDLLKEIEND